MDFYAEGLMHLILVVIALAMYAIIFLLGFAAIIALFRRVAYFILVDLSAGKRKLALAVLVTIDVTLVIGGMFAAASVMGQRVG